MRDHTPGRLDRSGRVGRDPAVDLLAGEFLGGPDQAVTGVCRVPVEDAAGGRARSNPIHLSPRPSVPADDGPGTESPLPDEMQVQA
jgi:hypothetical protein